MAKVLLGLKAEKEMIDAIDKKAEELGVNRTEFVMRAVDMLLNFDKSFLDILDQYTRLGLPEYLVIQNLIIKAEAEREAANEVYGKIPRVYTEFVMTDDGYLTGAKLFDKMKQESIRESKCKEVIHE